AERCRIGGQTGIDRELKVIVRIVGGRIRREAARRAVLEALIDGKDDELARATEPAMHEDPGEVGLGAGIVALVIVEDPLDFLRDLHGISPSVRANWGCAGSSRAARLWQSPARR